VFANRHKIPYDWPDNDDHQDGLDPTPLAPYLDIPAEIPGVPLERHQTPSPPSLPQSSTDHDWSRLANEAIVNADLDFEEHLPSPPEVIEIADKDEVNYSPPVNTLPLAKSELPSPPQVDPTIPSGPTQHTLCRSTRVRHPPEYLQDYLFTTVAEKQYQAPPPPYHTASGTDVDLTIQDER
jgi:hypothetical protein